MSQNSEWLSQLMAIMNNQLEYAQDQAQDVWEQVKNHPKVGTYVIYHHDEQCNAFYYWLQSHW